MGFDKIFDFLISQINKICPIVLVYQYEMGVRYFNGKYKKTLTPGIYFKIPYLGTILHESAVDTTILLPALSINNLVIRASIGYKIFDMGKYYNNVCDTKSAVSDIGCVLLRQSCLSYTKDTINNIAFGLVLCKSLQKEIKNYGIKINYFEIVELSESKSYKLFNEMVRLES